MTSSGKVEHAAWRTAAAAVSVAAVFASVALAAPRFTSTWKAPEAAGTSFAGTRPPR